MRRQQRAVWGMLLAVAGMTVVPARAQEQAAPVAVEAPVADAQAADAQAPLQSTLQTGQAPARARLSMAEKAAAVTGAVAAGVVAFKGLSALFKSGKSQPATPAPAN